MELSGLKETIKTLPDSPGIYKYFNKENTLIYVGKAKNLKKRVSSYFTKDHVDNKTRVLVSQICSIEYIVVNSETDALFLENNLIKVHQPKYNILLRDDKTYPYICISNDRFPKIYSTRKITLTKGEYFGPYSSVGAMNLVLDLIKKLFTIRNCELTLSENNIKKQKFKKCLEYHLGNCKAPCEDLQSENDYLLDISQAKTILNGDLSQVKKYFLEKLKDYSKSLNFENAQKMKWKLELLEKFQSNSIIVNTNLKDLAVFTIKSYESTSYINVLNIAFGRIIQSKTVEIINQLNESEQYILSAALFQLVKDLNITAKEVITNIQPDLPDLGFKINVPKIGDKRQLIDLSLKNIEFYKKDKIKNDDVKENPHYRILETMQKDLNLKELPLHIECFDNSNFQGSTPVAAMVCFRNGIPSKKDYRHFNIKTVKGPNDFESMKEIVYRRYLRLQTENLPLPNLIIIDGGKGQLTSAIKSLKKLNLYGSIPIISIAKRLEEIYVPEDNLPLLISKKSETLRLIQKIRDEVHRFGITFHRQKRDTIKIKKGR